MKYTAKCSEATRWGLLVSTALSLPGFAYAQSATAPAVTSGASTAQAAGGGSGTTLGEVIVTAQKRTENLESVPISIQASPPRS